MASRSRTLSIERALAGHLEIQPLLHIEMIWPFSTPKLLRLVIRLHQIFIDSGGLPEDHVCVRIFDSWHPSVRIDVDVRLLMNLVELHPSVFVW